jgi:CRP/FNR family cyclic AMP-dependent transcriptional regulator
MALEANAELLARGSIFQGLTTEQLTAITKATKKTFFEEGSKIVEADQSGHTAYLILSGKAVSCPPKGVTFGPEELPPGTLVGEMAMLVETVYSITIVAEERVRALAISREALFEVMEGDPSIAQHFSEKLLSRLTELAQDLHAVDAQFALLEASLDDAISAVA